MRKIVLLTLALGLASPIAARAQYAGSQSVGPSTTMFAKLGVVVPKDDDLEGFDNGLALEAGVGFKLSPNIGIDVAIGRWAVGVSETFFDPLVGTVNAEAQISAIPITGTLRLTAPAGAVDVYGLVGAGLYFVSMNLEADIPGYGSDSVSDDDTAFGFHLGGGIAARVSPNVSLGAELKYVIAEATMFDYTGGLNSVIAAASLGFQF